HTETRLLPPAQRSFPESTWQRTEAGPSAVLVMLGVRGGLPELPHHTLLLTRDWETELDAVFGRGHTPEVTSLYVCKPSATDDSVAPDGDENLFVLVPVSGQIGLGHGSGGPDWPRDEDPRVRAIADAAISQIARWSGVDDLAERVVVRHSIGPADFGTDYNSWADGMLGPAHTLAQSAMFRRGPRSRKVNGLFYAGATASPGVGVPMCLISAEIVLKQVRGDHSAGALAPENYPRGRA
ncbi:MAG: phytoene desaturase, partial [Mycetocola sp.]